MLAMVIVVVMMMIMMMMTRMLITLATHTDRILCLGLPDGILQTLSILILKK